VRVHSSFLLAVYKLKYNSVTTSLGNDEEGGTSRDRFTYPDMRKLLWPITQDSFLLAQWLFVLLPWRGELRLNFVFFSSW